MMACSGVTGAAMAQGVELVVQSVGGDHPLNNPNHVEESSGNPPQCSSASEGAQASTFLIASPKAAKWGGKSHQPKPIQIKYYLFRA